MYNLPNILTLSRIVVIPVIFLSIYIHSTIWALLAACLYAVAAITDYFDGYLARATNQISVFGRLLDPIADKLLVVAALLIIVANSLVSPIHYIPVMVILCREVLVSGLREFLAQVKVDMPVTKLAKWKTTAQMFAIGFILFSVVPPLAWANCIGIILLWVAGILTFITGYTYFKQSLDYVKSVNNQDEISKSKSTKKATDKVAEKAEGKKVAKKTVIKKTATKKATVKKAPVKKVTKKTTVKKVVAKKTTASKVASK